MAQLIKLQDYASRYEWNPYHYPGQYIRLKQDNWEKLHELWMSEQIDSKLDEVRKETTFTKLKSLFGLKADDLTEIEDKGGSPLPKTEIGLRHYFLDRLLPFQLTWATSTITDISFMNKKYRDDSTLKYFLQRFSDIYLVMYHPIFRIQETHIEGEIILISPVGVDIIYFLEKDPKATIMAGDDRTWQLHLGNKQTNFISPTISLKRTEYVIKSILHANGVQFPVHKTIISPMNNIVFSSEPYLTTIAGKYQYEEWFTEKRSLRSTLKSEQLKVSELLLKHCLTTSIKRPEWEEDLDVYKENEESE